MYNQEKLKKFAESVRKQTEKYDIPTAPKKKKKKKNPSRHCVVHSVLFIVLNRQLSVFHRIQVSVSVLLL